MKFGIDGRWYSSFGTTKPLDFDHSVLTVVSRRVWRMFGMEFKSGGHAFMYLEHITPKPETRLFDLWGDGETIGDQKRDAHVRNLVCQELKTPDSYLTSTPWWIGTSHIAVGLEYQHRSFSLDEHQKKAVVDAVHKFDVKRTNETRYTYNVLGGGVGWLFSGFGKRGINCVDFIIKVLRDSGLDNISHRLIATSNRVSSPDRPSYPPIDPFFEDFLIDDLE